jgi:hypothetical protein
MIARSMGTGGSMPVGETALELHDPRKLREALKLVCS